MTHMEHAKNDIGRDKGLEVKAANRAEEGANAAATRSVNRDFSSAHVGIGAGEIGHDKHLNGGAQDSSKGAVLDNARDAAVERAIGGQELSGVERSLIENETKKGIDASVTNPTMDGPDLGKELDIAQYDAVSQQRAAQGAKEPSAIAPAQQQPQQERIPGGLDAATQQAFAGLVKELGAALGGQKGGQSQGNSLSSGNAKGGEGASVMSPNDPSLRSAKNDTFMQGRDAQRNAAFAASGPDKKH